MSYPRPRSRGCHVCRARKVKCGQETLHCHRCLNGGRICPGYRPEDELVFRDMSKTAENRVQLRVEESKAKRGPLLEPSQASSTTASRFESEDFDFNIFPDITGSSSSLNDDQISESLIESVPLPMSPDWSLQAPCIFFADYVLVSKKPGTPPGYLEFLPDLCSEESESLCLTEALDAVSFANLTNRSSLAWLNQRARRSYGKALVSLNAALQDPQEVTKDSTLATVYLMGIYELINGDSPSGTFWDSHVGGGELLIHLRGSGRLQSDREKSLFRIMFTQIQLAHLIKRSSLTAEVLNLLNGLNKTLPNMVFAFVIFRLTKIRSNAPKAHKTLNLLHEPTQRRLKSWFEEALSLDTEMHTWAEVAKEKFPNLRHKEILNDPAAQPKVLHVYEDIWIASMWDHCRCLRVLLLLDLIDCEARFRDAGVSPLPFTDEQQTNGWNATITALVDEICASVPFLMGDLDAQGNLLHGAGRMALGGMFLLWPLHVIGIAGILRHEQTVWIKDRLKQMGYTMGIHQANVLRKRL